MACVVLTHSTRSFLATGLWRAVHLVQVLPWRLSVSSSTLPRLYAVVWLRDKSLTSCRDLLQLPRIVLSLLLHDFPFRTLWDLLKYLFEKPAVLVWSSRFLPPFFFSFVRTAQLSMLSHKPIRLVQLQRRVALSNNFLGLDTYLWVNNSG